MTIAKLTTLFILALLPLKSSMAAEADDAPEEIIVTGRQPGPPLWKVSNGGNVLWIFPYLEWVPKDMLWDSERVARVLSQSQEVLGLPVVDVRYPSTWVLNPLNILSNGRLKKRLGRNPDGGTLEDNLPPELFARYEALQARYYPLPAERGYLGMRPHYVGPRMMHIIRERAELVSGDEVLTEIARLRRNRDVRRTAISVDVDVAGSYGDYEKRSEELAESFLPELEQACFEQQVRLMEDMDETKRLANSWAQGDVSGFRNNETYDFSLAFGQLPACEEMMWGSSSPLQQTMERINANLNQMWLHAAVNALATNASTLAILPIHELLADDGLLGKLEARGYEVREP